MSLVDKLDTIKTEVSSLLTFANETTGSDDTTLGEAVHTLADGYGQGGGDDDLVASIIDGSVTEIRNDKVTRVRQYVFQNCSSLTSVDFSKATSVGDRAFENCSSLTSVDFPLATSIGSYAFYNCSKLTSVDFPLVTSINSYAFYNCSALTKLILRNASQVCKYSTSSSDYDPLNADLKIYVPRDLLEQYKVATNWSRLADKFVALEDYTVDGTTTGELIE